MVLSNEFIVAVVDSLFVPIGIQCLRDYANAEEREVIRKFGCRFNCYPTLHYVDPNDESNIVERLYREEDIDIHIGKLRDVTTEFNGELPDMLMKPYIVSVEPKNAFITINQSQTLEFKINAYDTDLSYLWFINDESQAATEHSMSGDFVPNQEYSVKAVIKNNANDQKVVTWSVNGTTGIQVHNSLHVKSKKLEIAHLGNSLVLDLYESQAAALKMFSLDGKLLKVIKTEYSHKGERRLNIDVRNFSTGVYLLNLEIGNKVYKTKQIVLVK